MRVTNDSNIFYDIHIKFKHKFMNIQQRIQLEFKILSSVFQAVSIGRFAMYTNELTISI